MNERELRSLFRRILMTSLPLQAAVGAAACGGSVAGTTDDGRATETGSGGERTGPSLTGAGGSGPTSCAAISCVGGSSSTGMGGTSIVGLGGAPSSGGTGGSFAAGGTSSAGGASTDAGIDASNATDPCAPEEPGAFCPPGVCVALPADLSVPLDGGSIPRAACEAACPDVTYQYCEIVLSQGEERLKCYQVCEGRRPVGLRLLGAGEDSLGQYFARIAHLEAASVAAFRRLHRELSRYGAPRSLRRSARRAARDEIRHARITRGLAESYRGTYEPPHIEPSDDRSFEAMVIENAVEGCVRETYGALVATYRAEHAADPEVRKAMRAIARDETRHAALAWRVQRWAERLLDSGARQRVAAERRAAAAALVHDVRNAPPAAAVALAGAPPAHVAQAMARAMSEHIEPLEALGDGEPRSRELGRCTSPASTRRAP